jgi:hypothetical protein
MNIATDNLTSDEANNAADEQEERSELAGGEDAT